MQGCLYGGQSTDGHLGDAWLFDSESMTWQLTATSDFGGFCDAAKAWHAAAVLKCADVRNHSSGRQPVLHHMQVGPFFQGLFKNCVDSPCINLPMILSCSPVLLHRSMSNVKVGFLLQQAAIDQAVSMHMFG